MYRRTTTSHKVQNNEHANDDSSLPNGNHEHCPDPLSSQSRRNRLQAPSNNHHRRRSKYDDKSSMKWVWTFMVVILMLIALGIVTVLHLLEHNGMTLRQAAFGALPVARTPASRSSGLPDDDKTNVGEENEAFVFPELPASSFYAIPNSLPHIGDKSDQYARMRKFFDHKTPPAHPERSLVRTREVRSFPLLQAYNEDLPYDVYNCPKEPPEGYPHEWQTTTLVKHWNPDDSTPPSSNRIYQGICVFDYRKDYLKALRYRMAEVPFVVQGDPAVAETVERWNAPNFLAALLRTSKLKHRAEYSTNNRFLYWIPDHLERKGKQGGDVPNPRISVPDDWKPPTEMIRMTFAQWLQHANVTDPSLIGPKQPHWYFRLVSCGETSPRGGCDDNTSEWLYDELTFFQPRPDQLYLVNPNQQRGIHCRFGMTGVTAENHFDSSRNAIVVLGGARRYILSHPKNCPNFALLPRGHPSARHSSIDWANPDLDETPEFAEATSSEVVLQAGDVLYLPTHWFHFIVSLNFNYQCNTRSGKDVRYLERITSCGF